MSSRRSRRTHNTHPKYSQDDFDADLDFSLNANANANGLNSNSSTSSVNESKRSTRSKSDNINQVDTNNQNDLDEIEEITRCICGSDELLIPKNNHGEFDSADPGFFIQCEKCSVWQHGYCVGIKDEENAPDKYWCEKCKPQFHTLLTDKFNIRRSQYNPNPNLNNNKNKLNKKRNHKSVKSDTEDKNSKISNDLPKSENDDYPDDDIDNHRRKHRKRPSYNFRDYNYEEMLKKAIEESAKESGVQPEDVNISSNETLARETRHSTLRKSRGKSEDIDDDNKLKNQSNYDEYNDENNAIGNIISNNNEEKTITTSNNTTNHNSSTKTTDVTNTKDSINDTNYNNINSLSSDNNNEINPTVDSNGKSDNIIKLEDKRKDKDIHTNKRIRNKRSTLADVNSYENSDSKDSTKNRSNTKKDKKDTNKSLAPEDKPFRANIPSQRINMNEMNRRIFSIMDFVSNIQINLSNEEEFKNNLLQMQDSALNNEINELKSNLLNCYNDSVEQLDQLTSLLNNWQNDFS